MNSILLHIKSGLLIACLLADSVSPLLLSGKYVDMVPDAVEMENETEPCDGKEEKKTGNDKIFDKGIAMVFRNSLLLKQLFFENPCPVASQIFLPVITPPPRVAA